MRALIPATTVLFLLAAAACGGGGGTTSRTPTTGPSSMPAELFDVPPPPPYARDFPVTTPRTPLPPDPSSAVESCVEDAEGPITEAALNDCLEYAGIQAATRPAEGPSNVILVRAPRGAVSESYHFIVWTEAGVTRVQNLTPLLPMSYGLAGGLLFSGDRTMVGEARESSRGSLLALTTVIYSGTSQTRAAAMLLARDNEGWHVAWDGGREKAMYELGHTIVAFEGTGIDTLYVEGSSWMLSDDQKRQVFHESNSGPHRYFEQTWVLRGEEYILVEEEVIPSAYNTLVEFMYALKTGDGSAAASLAVNSDLLARAQEAGIVQEPNDQAWLGWCSGAGHPYIDEPPCIVELPSYERVRVSMVPDGDSWLISAIEPEESAS